MECIPFKGGDKMNAASPSLPLFQSENVLPKGKKGTNNNSMPFDKVMEQSLVTKNSADDRNATNDADKKWLTNSQHQDNIPSTNQLDSMIDSSSISEWIARLSMSEYHEELQQLLSVLKDLEGKGSLEDVLQELIHQSDLTVEQIVETIMNSNERNTDNVHDLVVHTSDEMKQIKNELELENQLKADIIQLMSEVQSILRQIQHGEQIGDKASKLMPLLKEWSLMKKQVSEQAFQEIAQTQLSKEELEMMERIHELYEKRTHFQSKQMYGENATVTRTDVAQWLTAVMNQQQESKERTVPVINNEQMLAPRMSVYKQQAIYNSSMESVQRIEAEMTQRIANTIQQNMLLQQRTPLQSLSIVLTPEHLGTLNITFTQVDGDMIVRIITNSSFTKEVLESNLQQLKHAFSPHQVQIIRDDVLMDDDMMTQQEDEASSEEKDEEEQLDEEKEEEVSLDFSDLIQQLQEEEVSAYE